MNGAVKRKAKRELRMKELILAILQVADEGVSSFKNLSLKATMYVSFEETEPFSFCRRHKTSVASAFLCKEAEEIFSLQIEPFLDLTISTSLPRSGRDTEITFQVYRREDESNGLRKRLRGCMRRTCIE